MVVDDGIGIAAVLKDGLVQFSDVLGFQILQPQTALSEEGIQPGVDEALIALISSALDGGCGSFQPVVQEIRKQRGFLPGLLWIADAGAVLLLQFLQTGLGLAFIALHRNPQGNRLLTALSVLVIQI